MVSPAFGEAQSQFGSCAMGSIAHITPVLLQNLHLAEFGSAQDVFGRSCHRFWGYVGSRGGVEPGDESTSARDAGYVLGDQPSPKARLAEGSLCCTLAPGTYLRIGLRPG